MKIIRGCLLVPVLIVANTESGEPFDSGLARHCIMLGAAFIRALETSSVISRAGSLIRRFQCAQTVFDELNLHRPTINPKFDVNACISDHQAHLLQGAFHASASEQRSHLKEASADHHSSWITKQLLGVAHLETSFVKGSPLKVQARFVDHSTDERKFETLSAARDSAIRRVGRKRGHPLSSPRSAVGMSQRRTSSVVRLVKACLLVSREDDAYRSVRDVIRLISKSESRLVGKYQTSIKYNSPPCMQPQTSPLQRNIPEECEIQVCCDKAQLRKELRVMLEPKVVDVLLGNDFEHVPPKNTRYGPSASILQRGYFAYRNKQYERACALFDMAVAQDPGEVMVYFWRALAGARLGFYLQSVRDLDQALGLTLHEKANMRILSPGDDRNSIRQQQQKIELAIRFNRTVARAHCGVGALCQLRLKHRQIWVMMMAHCKISRVCCSLLLITSSTVVSMLS